MPDMPMLHRPIAGLEPSPDNPRTHSKAQIRKIARSIQEFGFLNPVLVDGSGRIVAGHGRIEAAKTLGITEVPTISVDHLTGAQVRAYCIADNRLAEEAGWDETILRTQLNTLKVEDSYDLSLTGFEGPELDRLMLPGAQAPVEERVPAVDRSEPAVSRLGDLWRVGDHQVLCGDSNQLASYQLLMGNEMAGMVFTDPPYNVPVQGHVSGLGKNTHAEFAMASGEMTREQFTAFLKTIFGHLVAFSADGSLHYICMDWRHCFEVLNAAEGTYTEQKNLCVWNKTNGGMGNLYRSQHELVFLYKNGTAPHINNVELGKYGRNRTNVWTYAGANAFSQTRDEDLSMHPTVKPVPLVADAILDVSKQGDIVLDAFGGSGTTLMAAEQTGRRGRVIEIDPHYVDTIVKRLEKATGQEATRGHGAETFETTKRWRRSGLD